MIYDYFFAPFLEYEFMRRALASCCALAVGAAPLGVFLMLRRMALVGDAMQHAILPGVSIAFLLAGVALWPMTLGGLAAGLLVALAAGAISRATQLKEDASFTGAYLISLALGVLIISMKGSTLDLMHLLFGNVLAVDNDALFLVTGVASLSLLLLATMYRNLIVECFDPGFLRAVRGRGALYHQLFLVLVVLNLVAAFQAMGTLMALGLMILPAIAARLWTQNIDHMVAISVGFGLVSTLVGLLASYHYSLPSGPSIVLTAGAIYIASVLFGRYGGLVPRLLPHKHLAG